MAKVSNRKGNEEQDKIRQHDRGPRGKVEGQRDEDPARVEDPLLDVEELEGVREEDPHPIPLAKPQPLQGHRHVAQAGGRS